MPSQAFRSSSIVREVHSRSRRRSSGAESVDVAIVGDQSADLVKHDAIADRVAHVMAEISAMGFVAVEITEGAFNSPD
jgi:hypothetical protein